jgi:hypothetical protein
MIIIISVTKAAMVNPVLASEVLNGIKYSPFVRNYHTFFYKRFSIKTPTKAAKFTCWVLRATCFFPRDILKLVENCT